MSTKLKDGARVKMTGGLHKGKRGIFRGPSQYADEKGVMQVDVGEHELPRNIDRKHIKPLTSIRQARER